MTDDEKYDSSSDAAAYAVNALSDQERAEFEAKANESETMRNEVIEMSGTAALLGLASPPVQPSADLKASLMARIATTPQLPREGAADAAPVRAEATTPTATPATAKANARWFTRPASILAAAAAAAALFVGGTVVGQSIVRNDFDVAQATALAQLQTADDAQQVSVDVAGGGEATLIWSLEQRRSVVMVDDLQPLPEGKTYQLWYIGESGPVSAGTFEAADSGVSWRVLDGQMTGGDVVGVTVEPQGGSEQPTTDPIVAIESA